MEMSHIFQFLICLRQIAHRPRIFLLSVVEESIISTTAVSDWFSNLELYVMR